MLRRAARRFIAGERLDEALEAITRLNRQGLSTTLDLLGEDTATRAQAEASGEVYLGIVDALRVHPAVRPAPDGVPPDAAGRADRAGDPGGSGAEGATDRRVQTGRADRAGDPGGTGAEGAPDRRVQTGSADRAGDPGDNNLSLKLTQLGLDVDATLCGRVLRRILDRAAPMFVRIDMESSAHTGATLDLFESLWAEGRRNVGVVLQAYLYRSATDVERLIALGARVRLVKGAYDEPPSAAYPRKGDVDAAFARLADRLLRDGTYPAIATHDERLIDHVCRTADAAGIAQGRFEFQMLYGIRRDLQTALRRRGYRVRVYVPFGEEWYPYFMRRLAERPANVGFVLRSVLRERAG